MVRVPDDPLADDELEDTYEGDLVLGPRPGLLGAILVAIALAVYLTANALAGHLDAASIEAGPDLVEVPNVAGTDEIHATRQLTDAGLDVTVSTVQNVQVASGVVIRQRPRFGERVPPGTQIEIVVSVGDGFARVPDIRGSNLEELELLLYVHGLGLGDIGHQESDAVADEVIGQLPAPGEVLPLGGVVHVMASAGPPMIEIPDVRGLAPTEARRLLSDLGFDSDYEDRYSGSIPRGDAISTEPEAGEQAPRGDRIVIFVSRGPRPAPPTTLPPSETVVPPMETVVPSAP